MPIYEFTDETGKTTDIYLTVAQLVDELVHEGRRLTRVKVPRRFATPRIVQSEYQAQQVMRGYRALEDAGTLRKSTYTPEQVKAAWALPDNEG